MPIRPENKHRYPPNWREIRTEVLLRAENCCEGCGVPNHAVGYRRESVFHYLYTCIRRPTFAEKKGSPLTWIVLTIAHLNGIPEDCRMENLKALCQRCHLQLDMRTHVANRSRGRYERREKAGQLRMEGA